MHALAVAQRPSGGAHRTRAVHAIKPRGTGVAARAAVRAVGLRAGARAGAVRLPAHAIAVGSNTGVIAVRIGRYSFAAVAALEDAEVIQILS